MLLNKEKLDPKYKDHPLLDTKYYKSFLRMPYRVKLDFDL